MSINPGGLPAPTCYRGPADPMRHTTLTTSLSGSNAIQQYAVSCKSVRRNFRRNVLAELAGCARNRSHSPTGGSRRSYVIHQFVHRTFPCPRNPAEKHALHLIIREVRVSMALHPDESPRRLTARDRMFIRPD